jgi:hypothetical protein
VLRNFASAITLPPPSRAVPTRAVPAQEELGRLRKATVYADIIEAGGITIEAVDGLTEGQWAALAIVAKTKPPSPETCAVIRHLLHQRQEWRELVALENGCPMPGKPDGLK